MAVNTDQRTDSDGSDGGVEGEPEARVGLAYTLSQLKKDTTARIGMAIIGFMTLVAVIAFIDGVLFDYFGMQYILAETIWYNPIQDSPKFLRPPVYLTNQIHPNDPGTWAHPLGTDHRGRDILSRLFYGTRIAMTVGLVATVIGMALGALVGATAGFYGGYVDDALMRAAETLYAIPFLILVIAFMTAFGRDLTFAMIGVGIASIPTFARLIRSRVLSVREEDYIEAARAAGVRDRDIILRHLIPNSFAPVLVQATLQIGVNILIVAGLSFLGFGAQPPTPSWGQMLSSSRQYMLPNLWFSVWPGLAILVTVIGFNIVGDGLRDALDPRINN